MAIYTQINSDGTSSLISTDDYFGDSANVIGNVLKTSYNKLTGYTKIDNRPATVSAEAYALQVRGYNRSTTANFTGVDNETDLKASGTGSIRGVQGVGKIASGVTGTGSTIIGTYGQARVDGTMAGNSFLVGLYGLVEASTAITANHVTSCWLDSHQANTVTGAHDLLYMTNNGAAVMDQAIHLYGGNKITNLIKLDTCSGMVSANAETGGTSKKIKILVGNTTYYINAYTG